MKTSYKGCKGCNVEKQFKSGVLSVYNIPCYFKVSGNVKVCPCTECLVKVMCRQPCDLRVGSLMQESYNKSF